MRRIWVLFVLCAVLLNSARASGESGGTVGSGGDAIVGAFTGYARMLQGLLARELKDLFPEVDAEKLGLAIESARVISRDELILDGVEKDAVTNVREETIQVSRKRWPHVMRYSIQSRYQLVFHEYLHILRIEDRKYEISSRLLKLDESVFIGGYFSPLNDVSPSSGYLRYFDQFGQPRFNFSDVLAKRFGSQLNRVIYAGQQSKAEREKARKLYRELAKAVDRGRNTQKSYLLIDDKEADKRAKEFELKGTLSKEGAWSIALATAKLHDFAHVFGAEFVSELVREAYGRSGYEVTDDFNVSRGNELKWPTTITTQGLSESLFRAGWVPWDSIKYRPPIGAIAFHQSGRSPGHCWAIAGQDGRWIVDNGSPQGRDLGQTKEKAIFLMYQGSVFFLPPGILPNLW